MERIFTIYFSTFQIDKQSAEKLQEDQVGQSLMIVPLWRNQFWFPLLLESLIECPARLPAWKNILLSPTGEPHPFGKKVKADRMSCIRTKLKIKGLSKQASAIFLSSWRNSTSKQYNLAWKKWVRWAVRWEINPIKPSEAEVINYLAHLLNEGKSYSVVNTHRSTLTQTLASLGHNIISESPLVKRFMKGVFEYNPPKPRYSYTWDVSIILKHLETLYPLSTLFLEKLSKKLVSLVALTTA